MICLADFPPDFAAMRGDDFSGDNIETGLATGHFPPAFVAIRGTADEGGLSCRMLVLVSIAIGLHTESASDWPPESDAERTYNPIASCKHNPMLHSPC